MRKLLLTAALAGTTLIAPGLVSPASAGGWFGVGTGFRVGAAHISFVFGQPFGHYAPAYYYRYDRPISYRGHSCNRYCYRESGHYYHHESCPLVRAHFRAYNVDPYWAYSHYAPHGDYGRYDGYYSDGYYGGVDVYYSDSYRGDRYRNRYDDRYYRDGRRDRRYNDDRYYRDGRRDRRYNDDRYYRDGRRGDRHHRDYDRHRGRRQHRHYRGCGH